MLSEKQIQYFADHRWEILLIIISFLANAPAGIITKHNNMSE